MPKKKLWVIYACSHPPLRKALDEWIEENRQPDEDVFKLLITGGIRAIVRPIIPEEKSLVLNNYLYIPIVKKKAWRITILNHTDIDGCGGYNGIDLTSPLGQFHFHLEDLKTSLSIIQQAFPVLPKDKIDLVLANLLDGEPDFINIYEGGKYLSLDRIICVP